MKVKDNLEEIINLDLLMPPRMWLKEVVPMLTSARNGAEVEVGCIRIHCM